MTDSLSVQFIRFACKQCGRIFTRVPYEHIVQYGIAECSSCKARFTLDPEEIQTALIEAQELEAEDSLDIEENQELDAADSLDIEENPELDAADSLDIEENPELDAADSLDIEENPELDAADSLDIEENPELDAADSLDIEENPELDATDNLDIEENPELDAADNLDIEENPELDAADSLDIEENPGAISPEPLIESSGSADTFNTASASLQQPDPLQEPSRTVAGFEPEKEDKVEFARRLSRLIPEGWVNPSQDSGNETSLEPTGSDSSTSDLEQLKDHHQFLVFALGTAEFAVPVENTTEIGMVPELTRLPHVPGWLLGITNLRGDIISVVDMKNFLGMGPFDFDRQDRIILLRSLQEDICTAIIVNRIVGMQYVAEHNLIMTDTGQQGSEPHILGMFEMDERSIAVLDIDNLLLSNDMQQFRAL